MMDIHKRNPTSSLIKIFLCSWLGFVGMPAWCYTSDNDPASNIPDRLFKGNNPPEHLSAQALPGLKTKNIVAPAENSYFPVRSDGQPFMLNADNNVNLTDAMNRFYYESTSRHEFWMPFNNYEIPEKAQRMLSTWDEYNQENAFRTWNPAAMWLEIKSGYGP